LCLSRKKRQTIVIGDGADKVELHVVWIHGNTVRLAIDAPRAIKIMRGELRNTSRAKPV
jgi:carbon storage regulator CsrA